MPNPKLFQTLIRISAGIAQVSEISQDGPSMPNHPSTVFTRPSCGMYSQIQTNATATVMVAYGNSRSERKIAIRLRPWLSRSARPRLTRIVSGTLTRVKYTVLPSADQNVGSGPRRAKLCRPAQVGALNRFQFSSEMTPAATTGPAVKIRKPIRLGRMNSQAVSASRLRQRGVGGDVGRVGVGVLTEGAVSAVERAIVFTPSWRWLGGRCRGAVASGCRGAG